MSGYIGTQPVPQATQTRDSFTATANQTSFATSGYTPEFLDVFLNGVKLAASDYTATNGSDVVLASGAAASDILEVVAYSTFEVLNPTFDGNVTFTGNASFGDNDKAIFGAGSDLQIYHDGTRSIIQDNGDGNLRIQANNLELNNADNSENYLFAANNGAVTLYHDNAAKLATTATGIDVTGNVDTSGLFRFGVNNSEVANNYLRFKSGGAAYFDHSTVGQDFNFRVSNASSLDTNAMTIDSSGNVGIGESSPSTYGKLVIAGSTPFAVIRSTDTTTAGISMLVNSGSLGVGSIATDNGGHMTFDTGSTGAGQTERMRIDASGNLLVGTTTYNGPVNASSGDYGAAIWEGGLITSGTNASEALALNRMGSDGDIAVFKRSSSTVGSIATQGSRLSIGSGDVNLNFNASANSMYPISDPAAGTLSSGIVDLGAALATFKDAYLSGGVYLGGTGSANKLDDYEEGSYNTTLATDTSSTVPTFAGTTYYVKVGDIVHLHGQVHISGSSSGGINLHIPLPFTPTGMRGALTVGLNQALSMKPNGEYLGIIVELNIAKGYIVSTAFGGGHSHLGFDECGSGLFSFSGSYRTA